MNKRQLKDIIALGEGFTTEFKRSGTSNLGREICAFANATGGVILIGVSDSGEMVGVDDHNRLKSEIQAIARSADPPISVDVDSVGQIICVTVPRQSGKPYSFGGKFFMREGATSQQMSREEIREFFFKEGLVHFDETPCSRFSLIKDLTKDVWERFQKRAKIPTTMEALPALENLHLVRDGQMTHAGAWLLAKDIRKFTISADVACALFMGTDKERILDRRGFHSDVYSLIDEVIAFILSKINVEYIIRHVKREERPELPEEALREAVVNAIAHRNYRSTGNVQIYIFKDRIEIVSPGGLPAGMTVNDLGFKSIPRNPLLFGMLHRMEAVEHIGSGIKRIRNLCREYGVLEPGIEVSENWFTVVFHRTLDKKKMDRRQPQATNGAKRGITTQQDTLHVAPHVTQHVRRLAESMRGEMGRDEIMDALDLKDRMHFVNSYLRPALDGGIVQMTYPEKPRSRNQKYRITDKGKKWLNGLKEGEE